MTIHSKVFQNLHLDEVLDTYQPYTVTGKREELVPFRPGEEKRWQCFMEEQEVLAEGMDRAPDSFARLEKPFSETPSIDDLLLKLKNEEPLVLTEWFTMKRFLWTLHAWCKEMDGAQIPHSLWLSKRDRKRVEELLWKLNPNPPLRYSFSLDNEYDERLLEKRTLLFRLERKWQEKTEQISKELDETYGLSRNPMKEWVIDRASEVNATLKKESRLHVAREITYDLVYELHVDDTSMMLDKSRLQDEIRHIEEEVMHRLTHVFAQSLTQLENWMTRLTHFDILWARVRAARSWQGIKPALSKESFSFTGGVHPYVAQSLERKGHPCTPVDFHMKPGIAIIIGPNMGGKTVGLKTVGIVAALGVLGFYVPAKECELPLFPWIGTVLSDAQHIEHGLSSYGAEISQLQTWINQSETGLLLIDELGRSTNPMEGSALVRAVAMHLRDSGKWSVLVTHYREIMEVDGIQGYRIAGLSSENIEKLDQTNLPTSIQENMDYRLIPMKPEDRLPQQALLIAKLLGLDGEIVKKARCLVERDEVCSVTL